MTREYDGRAVRGEILLPVKRGGLIEPHAVREVRSRDVEVVRFAEAVPPAACHTTRDASGDQAGPFTRQGPVAGPYGCWPVPSEFMIQ